MKKFLLALSVCVLGEHAFTQEAKEKNNFNADSTREKLMPPIEIRAVRAGETYPFAKTLLNKRAIEKNNQGQDIPFLLNQVPGTLAHSDAGNGFGYTGLRIRGTDASRINFTLNGIAYNDAESQGVFLVNLPDFLSSVNSIQVQRGVGTSSNGTGAFGATVNMLTNEVHHLETHGDQPQIVETVPGWTHNITNIGSDEMVVMLWANEIFDRANPDTIASQV